MAIDIDLLDAAFFADEPKEAAPSVETREGMSWAEYHWRMTDKIFDENRKRQGLRAIRKDQRERGLLSYLDSLRISASEQAP